MYRLSAFVALLNGVCAYSDNLEIVVENFANHRNAIYGVAPGSLIRVLPLLRSDHGSSSHTYLNLSGLSLRMRPHGASSEMDLPLLLIQYNLAAALPPDLPLGDAVLTYVEQGRESTPAPIPIVASSFGLFVKGYSGEGPVIAQNVSGEGILSANQLTNAAHPGQFISLWGTGLGSPGEGGVEVEIGGKTVLPTYAGAVAGLPGNDQINVLIPPAVPTGCYVPVIVRAGGTPSNTASISITDQGTVCNHPLNLSSDALATLDAGKSTGVSLITFESDIREDQAHEMYWRQEYGLAEFANGDAAAVMAIAGFTTTNDMLPSCRLVDNAPFSPLLGILFDAGEKITFAGPGGQVFDLLPAGTRGFYHSELVVPEQQTPSASMPQRDFQPGVWTVHAPGGAGIAAFETQMTLPAAIRWTNPGDWKAIDPTQDQSVTWDATGVSTDGIVEVALQTTYCVDALINGGCSAANVTGICRTAASAERITLPASIIGPLAAAASFSGLTRITITLVPRNPVILSVPLANGGVIGGTLGYRLAETSPTQFR